MTMREYKNRDFEDINGIPERSPRPSHDFYGEAREHEGAWDRRYEPQPRGYGGEQRWVARGRGSRRSERRRDQSGLWARMKEGMRQGWAAFQGVPDRHAWRDRDESSAWDDVSREAREGWERVKETFRGRGPKGYTRPDERIREDVCDRLTGHPQIDAGGIDVIVRDGEVTLDGTIDDRRQKRLAENIAEEVSGVKEVANRLRVSRESSVVGTVSTGGERPRQG